MASFNRAIITNKGMALIAKSLINTDIKFTKIRTSEKDYSTVRDLENIISIENVKQTELVSETNVLNNSTVQVIAPFTNTLLTTGYYLRTIGLYANDPDEGEILYSITTAVMYDWIPPFSSTSVTSFEVKLSTVISNSNNLDLTINPEAVVNISQFNKFKEQVVSQLSQIDTHVKGLYLINVKGLGAKGDGITDDTQVIQNAINLSGINGGIVYFPEGDYKISDTLVVNKYNVELRGVSSSKSTIIQTDITKDIILHDLQAQGRHMRGLKLKFATPSAKNCISIDCSDNINPGWGFCKSDFYDLILANCGYGIKDIDDGKFAIWGCNFEKITVHDFTVSAISLRAKEIAGTPNNTMRDIRALNGANNTVNTGNVFEISSMVSLENINVEDCYNCIINGISMVGSAKFIHIERHRITKNDVPLFWVSGDYFDISDIEIYDLYLKNPATYSKIFGGQGTGVLKWNIKNVKLINFVSENPQPNLGLGMIGTNGTRGRYVLKNLDYLGDNIVFNLGWEDGSYNRIITLDEEPYKMTEEPSKHTWTKGDRIMNINPSAGGFLGWICITAGVPGAWKGFGIIAS